ncbi:hypothetical protein MRX96_018179 [Rhipicephalus microplus]
MDAARPPLTNARPTVLRRHIACHLPAHFFAWLFACRLLHARPGRHRLLTTSSGHGHHRDRTAVVAHRPAHLVLPDPAVAVRSCCLPGPPPWILPTRVPRGAVVPGGATLLPLLAPRHHPLLRDLGAGLRVLPRRALHRRRRLRRPRRDQLVPKHRRPHALLPRCNHASRPWTATFCGFISRPRRSCSARSTTAV